MTAWWVTQGSPDASRRPRRLQEECLLSLKLLLREESLVEAFLELLQVRLQQRRRAQPHRRRLARWPFEAEDGARRLRHGRHTRKELQGALSSMAPLIAQGAPPSYPSTTKRNPTDEHTTQQRPRRQPTHTTEATHHRSNPPDNHQATTKHTNQQTPTNPNPAVTSDDRLEVKPLDRGGHRAETSDEAARPLRR